jgi:hypothetical protein
MSIVQRVLASDIFDCKGNEQQGLAFEVAKLPAAAEQQVGERSRWKSGKFVYPLANSFTSLLRSFDVGTKRCHGSDMHVTSPL